LTPRFGVDAVFVFDTHGLDCTAVEGEEDSTLLMVGDLAVGASVVGLSMLKTGGCASLAVE